MKNIFSSGGVGDALIVGLKIQKIKKNNPNEEIQWVHAERHSCHQKPISEIMKCFTPHYECVINNDSELFAKTRCDNIGGLYLNTKIMGVVDPYLDGNLGVQTGSISNGNIVFHLAAGRMHDATKRSISVSLIDKISKEFPANPKIILGTEREPSIDWSGNLTGLTSDILHAFAFIDKCSLFVGQDGVLAYYAMMLRKPTIVHYHIPSLIGHYFNQEWAYHSIALFGAGNNLEDIDLTNPETQALFNIVRQL